MDKNMQLSNLGVMPNPAINEIVINNAIVKVEDRIPYEKVLEMIQWCITYIINDRPFVSAPLKRIIKEFAIIKYYTNIDCSFMEEFTEVAQVYENYDLLNAVELIDKVIALINPSQYKFFDTTLDETLESIEKYRNSAKGIIDELADSAGKDSEQMEKILALFKDELQNENTKKILQISAEQK